jgi:class 3 adenylate cyclase
MTFDEVLAQVQELLQREQRVSYRGLKRRFALDDEYLEDLKEELIGAKRLATDEDGRFLVWTGEQGTAAASSHLLSPQSSASLAEPPPPEAERRQLTVMFCDLVGSTELSTQLDPEELREVILAYRECCATVIHRFAGYLAKYIGDGLLVYFGYPVAHEDDAQRAVRVGLGIVDALQKLSLPRMRSPRPLQVRIGIHTGLVIAGEMGVGDQPEPLAIVGETPNIAARVQGHAEPNEVLISATTSHLIEGLFACEDRGRPALKGVTTPLTLYRVVQASEAHSRFEVVVRRGLTPLIGRDPEFGLLQERWARVKDGAGQVVLLSGEPGIGKSRLLEALKETVEHEGARCLELRCSPYAQNSTLAPVIEHVQRLLQFSPTDGPKTKLEKLHQALSRYRFPQADTFPLLAAVLSLPLPDDVPSLPLSPQKQKEKTQEVLVAWLCEEAKQQAVTYAWEDLHWADPSTLELLTLFLAQVPTTRLLAVLTYRPEFTPLWGAHSYLSQLTLSRLGQTHVEVMVEKVTGGKALPREVVRQIASKTDGVPLFVEELTKMVVESDLVKEVNGHYELSGPLPPLAIPSTLQDSLMARLDRLATVREIAQIGATIGREFNYDLLQAVSTLNEEALQQGLRQLVESELVFQSGVPPQARYLFKHALVQDTAYQSLLKSRRQQLHQQVAQVLTEQFSEIIATQPELVAHHYTEAGLMARAIPYWQQAGQRAIQRSANEEAVTHLTTGLTLLNLLPETSDRDRQELTLRSALGSALVATKGQGAAEVRKTYDEAREVAQRIGEAPQLFSVLFGLGAYYIQQEEMKITNDLGEECLALAEKQQDPLLIVAAFRQLITVSFWSGNPQLTHEYCERALRVPYDPRHDRSLALASGFDPLASCRGQGAWALWYLGSPDQALQRSQLMVTLARELAHPYTLAYALDLASWTHWYRREGQAAYSLADEAITLSTAHDFPHWLAMGLWMRGQALIEQGREEEGVQQLQHGIEAYHATGARIGTRGCGLAELARGYGRRGQSEEGLRMITEALAELNQVRHYEAEMYRIKGELLLQQFNGQGSTFKGESLQSPFRNPQLEAEACFLKALAIAQSQKAKSWELRAATSLARLWQSQSKRKEAHRMLSDIYHWFTEGLNTKDLQEAKALLDELS